MRVIGLAAVVFVVAGSAGCGSIAHVSHSAKRANWHHATLDAISCSRIGDCAAGGVYDNGPAALLSFVVSETRGSWGTPIEVPTPTRIGYDFVSEITSISCPAAGECAAGGFYTVGARRRQAFLVSERRGRWSRSIAVGPNLGEVDSISCGAPGECAAIGSYGDGAGSGTFVVDETKGRWGKAIKVHGTRKASDVGVESIACAAAGQCAAGGWYVFGRPFRFSRVAALVMDQTNGSWGDAIAVPGTVRSYRGEADGVRSISCAAAGGCAAGGGYIDDSGTHAFVVDETKGTWGKAIEVPGTATLDSGGYAIVTSISCAAAGECVVGGSYSNGPFSPDDNHYQAFVSSEANGRWGDAIEVPGTARLNTGGNADLASISCPAVGDCAASGTYTDGSHRVHVFVVDEKNGNWSHAHEVQGTATGEAFGDPVDSISCAAAGDCAAGGSFNAQGAPYGAFVVDETNGSWGKAIPVRKFPARCIVPGLVEAQLGAAKRALSLYHCRLGRIKTVYSDAKKGRVLSQRPNAGADQTAGASVALTVSRGAKT